MGDVARFVGQLNLAVINLQNKRPPLMPLGKGSFATKQASDQAAKPEDVSADEVFLNAGLSGGTNEAVERETIKPDGSIDGTIDEDGDGSIDRTFTQTKPVETAKPDGTKSLAMAYAFDSKGEKDVFDVKEDIDANGKVTGGSLDWTANTLGKQHIDFKPDEITLEPFPGMFFVMKPAGLDALGHVKTAGDIVFDDRFASSKQLPGKGLPEQQPMATQAQTVYTKGPERDAGYQVISGWADSWGRVSAGAWCIDNEVGWSPNQWTSSGWEQFAYWVRYDWCKTKNIDRWWANQHRQKLEKTGRIFTAAIGNPALRLQVAMVTGNKPKDVTNLLITMANGSEMRITMPTTGEPTGQAIDK
ncbi:MAG: hypothetical protein H7338_25125 [Candidatus Sericytochromatia bacterium]|nr:hypothetical protein [Candidatus Sericytochromatia bacterium]